MRDVSFCTDSFAHPSTHPYSERVLACLLWGLIFANEAAMLAPTTGPRIPPLYASGVRWVREEPRPGRTGCAGGNGQERFLGAAQVLAEGEADCEDLVAWRVGELRTGRVSARFGMPPRPGHPPVTVCPVPYPMHVARGGVDACPAFFKREIRPGFTMYHILVAWMRGGRPMAFEDPSRVLGMGRNTLENRGAA